MKPEPLTSSEYTRMYDTGVLPERFFDREAARLTDRYLKGEIDITMLDSELDPDGFRLGT